MRKTKDKSPSKRGKGRKAHKDIPGGMLPLSQGLKEYFEEHKTTDGGRDILPMELERYLYVKGLNKLHEVILSLEGRIADSYNTIGDRDDITIEELIDTIADELGLGEHALRHTLISMALRE